MRLTAKNVQPRMVRLNPYYNGRYSMSDELVKYPEARDAVLILIIMEDTLWGAKAEAEAKKQAES